MSKYTFAVSVALMIVAYITIVGVISFMSTMGYL